MNGPINTQKTSNTTKNFPANTVEIAPQTYTHTTAPFSLFPEKFMILKKCSATAWSIALGSLAATIGLAFPVLGKIIDTWQEPGPLYLTTSDWLSLAFPVGTTVIAFIVGLILNYERRKLCSEISKFYRDYPSLPRNGGQA